MIEMSIFLLKNSIILLTLIGCLSRFGRVPYSTAASIVGTFVIIVYVVAVGIPFYFQDYSEAKFGSPSLGLTQNRFIGFVAYLLTFRSDGFTWILLSMLFLSQGKIFNKPILDAIYKSLLFFIGGILILYLHKYTETINFILE